jgi:hypothetical protein
MFVPHKYLHVLAENCGHPQGATNIEDMYSMLYRVSNTNTSSLMKTEKCRSFKN